MSSSRIHRLCLVVCLLAIGSTEIFAQNDGRAAAVQALIDALNDRDALVTQVAANSLGAIGPEAGNAVPMLVDLWKRDWKWSKPATSALGHLGAASVGPMRDILSARGQRTSDVLDAFGTLGPDAAPAISDLAAVMREGTIGEATEAALALAGIGPPAADTLISASRARDPEVQHASIVGLARLRPTRDRTVTALISLIRAPARSIRSDAVWALEQIGPDARAAIPALSAALRATEPRRVQGAADALAAIGAVPALVDIMATGDSVARSLACRSLGQMGARAAAAVPALQAALASTDPFLPTCAIQTLGLIGPAAKQVATALIALGWPDKAFCGTEKRQLGPFTESSVIEALGRIAAESAVPLLLECLGSSQRETQVAATVALGRLGPDAAAALPALREIISHRNHPATRQAVQALARIAGATAAAEIIEDLDLYPGPWAPFPDRDYNETLRLVASMGDAVIQPIVDRLTRQPRTVVTEIIPLMGPRAGAVTPALIPRLEKDVYDSQFTFDTTKLLAAIGPEARAAKAALLRRLSHRDGSVRQATLAALASLGPEVVDVMPEMVATFRADVPWMVEANVFVPMGPAAIRHLTPLIADTRPEVRAAGLEAIGSFGPAAASLAAEAMRLLKEDAASEVRVAAARALGRMLAQPSLPRS